METVTVSTLKTFEALKNVPEDQLQWLINNSADRLLADGEYLTQQGQPLAGPHFMIKGRIVLYIIQNGSRREIATIRPGDISGYLPYSRGITATASSHAVGEAQIMSFPTERIREMVKDHFELTQALVHVMSNRVREFTAMQQQNEKMMALGKLSAGLAHELNNPASAIVRDSVSLLEHLKMEPVSFKKVISIQMTGDQIDAVNNELFRLLAVKDNPELSLKERTKREEEIAEWLDERNIENSYDLAENFVDFGFGVDNLETFCSHIPTDSCSPVFNWIGNLLTTERMVQNIQESSHRIANLVNSVKVFTHMDRGSDKQYADIHIGIKNTLMMLIYKIKKGNITMVKEFDQTLPPVNAMIGELNQVWTNLIDNALDAMEPNGKGTLTIKTKKDREFVRVYIIDDGPGIPDEIKSRIFDPFFTTKEMGKGTGMGLEVVHRIVHQHNGSIKVKSEPGRTEFIVCFPIDG
ncbi:ATP-binding protein [Mucilaginibacter sp.]|uniref:sensor histidine kinase n=1 Tax=Mucilaginibacter sp. TaxID=1882438 RepID=UPI002847FD2C|nr:ATP-binding protein [Mucilaginibacter sp.]MDR3695351.1 ATP-binding protein [Mucilaginibacter sp.]